MESFSYAKHDWRELEPTRNIIATDNAKNATSMRALVHGTDLRRHGFLVLKCLGCLVMIAEFTI